MAQTSWDLDAQAVVLVLDDGETNTAREILKTDPRFLDNAITDLLKGYATRKNDAELRRKIAESNGWGRFDAAVGGLRLA